VLLNRPLAFRSFISSVVYSCAKARRVANISTWAVSSPGQGLGGKSREGGRARGRERAWREDGRRKARVSVGARVGEHPGWANSGFANSLVLRPLSKLLFYASFHNWSSS
jgi:hypothetical protein